MDQPQRNGAIIELEEKARQNDPPVRFRLEGRYPVVAITIDERDDASRNARARRKVDVEHDPGARERDARSLKIFVETMCGRRRRKHEEEACRRREGTSHRLVTLAA